MRYIIVLITILLCAQGVFAMEPFSYVQDFEKNDPVQKTPWAVGATYSINYQGLTDERSHSGKMSYKIDVNVHEGSYLYFSLPVNIPVQGKLKFSAYVFIPEENRGRAGTGVNYIFPPTPNSGCSPINGETFQSTNGQWKYVEGDLTAEAKRNVKLITQYMWGVDGDQLDAQIKAGKSPVGIFVDRIGIFLMGSQQRIVMYLDDIKIEGEAPDSKTYESAYMSEWNKIQKKISDKKSSWLTKLDAIEKEMGNMGDLTGDADTLRTDTRNYMSTVKSRIDATLSKPYLELVDQSFIDGAMQQIVSMRDNIKELSSGKMKLSDMRISIVPSVSSNKILPSDVFIPGKMSNTISVSACPGEITAASFVIRPLRDMRALKTVASDLKYGTNTIKSADVDLKMVKCWYQSGSAWQGIGQNKSKRILVPELLLNDSSLVEVDHDRQDNFLKCNFSDGDKYLLVSSNAIAKSDTVNHTISEYPVKDAKTLQPVSLTAGTNQQYWVTFKIPAKTKAGLYSGRIRIMNEDTEMAVLNVKVNVLPFTLDPPYYTSSIYYRGVLRKGWEKGSISSEFKSEKQLFAELKNMVDHGVDSPTVYQPIGNKYLLGRYLSLYRKAGWKGNSVYFLGTSVGAFKFTTPEGLEDFKKACIDTKQFMKKYGVDNLYVYGIDEATGEVLASQRKAFAAAHEAGVKLFVAGYDGTFDSVGDLLDILVYAGGPSKLESSKWHSIKHKVWSYANPQGGVENPEVYRRNFGLLLWSRKFDGACTYAYQHAFGSIWNDFDNLSYRDHNMTYPTVDGVIDTIAWEGYREGVNDVKYLTTLMNSIRKAKAKGKMQAVKAAEKFVESIDVVSGDLDQIRAGMAKHIIALKK